MRIFWQSFVDASVNAPYMARLSEYLNTIAAPGTTVHVEGISPPDREFGRLAELRCAVQAIDNGIAAEQSGFDALVMGHFQDPGLYELRSTLDIPVIGTGEATLLAASHLGPRLGLVTLDRGVYRLPDAVSYEEATFIEPLACVIRAQQRLHIGPGKTVLVLGSGISGLLHIHLARTLGATRIIATDVDGYRLDAARRCGADDVIPAREDVAARLREKNEGRLADIVIACTGVLPALEQALTAVDRGGTVLFFAPTDRDVIIPLSINRVFWRNDVTLTTSYAGDQADHLAALELIRSRRVRVADMITHRLGLAQTVRGFELVAQARDSIKVVIEPQR